MRRGCSGDIFPWPRYKSETDFSVGCRKSGTTPPPRTALRWHHSDSATLCCFFQKKKREEILVKRPGHTIQLCPWLLWSLLLVGTHRTPCWRCLVMAFPTEPVAVPTSGLTLQEAWGGHAAASYPFSCGALSPSRQVRVLLSFPGVPECPVLWPSLPLAPNLPSV